MDASESLKSDADIKNVFSFFLKIDDKNYSTPVQQKSSTVIKYTKLPDFDVGPRLSWLTPQQSNPAKPRTRRIVTLGDEDLKVNRSERSNFQQSPKIMAANYTKRKMITISENDEQNLHPKFTKDKKTSPMQLTNRSTGADYKSEKLSPHRTTSRLTSSQKYAKETKSSAKINSAYNKKGAHGTPHSYRLKYANSMSSESSKIKYVSEKDVLRITNSNPNKTVISKNFITPSESEELIEMNSIMYDSIKTKAIEKPKQNKAPLSQNKNKLNINKMFNQNKTLTIRVPLDQKYEAPKVTEIKSTELITPCMKTINTCNRSNMTSNTIHLQDVKVGTKSPILVDGVTEMDDIIKINTICKCESSVQTESINEIFDSLEIPNVTLTKDKSESNKEALNIQNESFPDCTVPTHTTAPQTGNNASKDLTYCQSASYIFSQATLTYTTRQKINFHVINDDKPVTPNILPAPIDCPLNVVSVFKNNVNNKNKQENVTSSDTYIKNKDAGDEYVNCLNELNSLNCSYVFNKLMKPSEIISTIRVNNDLLQNDYICEQFQRELNFIDSFFESLQYLESCSLSDKGFSDNKVESLVNNSVLFDSTFDIKNSEYDNFLSKLENGANIDETETMASKSLFLLNLLIRDEQRRAKNLLFVLKMREDALKDFTKSQILWLEKKKKHDNTDISTLKKKQRGALLKLQHECGEMQRMRKALLTLSEKRKVALLKTKKNIELKLKNNIGVEQIILGKKKLKRSLSGDRNTSPLKCFDLSSSGCEDSTTSKLNSDTLASPGYPLASITSAEKCVQAGDTLWSEPPRQLPDIAAENFVAVDGGYLNILFHDLTLPQIFYSGKQYDVNEEMLKNIINSTNNYNNNFTGSEAVEKLMDHIKNRELDTSSPSTARSLVEEFDQYYRGLAVEDKSPSCDQEFEDSKSNVKNVQTDLIWEPSEEQLVRSVLTMSVNEEKILSDNNLTDVSRTCVCDSVTSVSSESSLGREVESCTSQPQTGPLPVPVGAAAVVESSPPSILPTWSLSKSNASTFSDTDSVSSQPLNSQSLDTLPSHDQSEAEELRRQQLAIEREIKALEQQQSRLLVVREIPDKPPPPYTPPTENKPKPPRMFTLDEPTETKVREYLSDTEIQECEDNNNAFDIFLKDYCHESLERHKQEQSDKPWDACNLLPQKPPVDTDKLVQNTITEIKEVLTTAGPTVVSGVSGRRSDHIDDILFTEWKRCEPEWTNLHNDEAIVKNQIFETIFQKILNETVDEYKKTVTNCITD